LSSHRNTLCSYSVLREGKGEVLQRANDVFYNKAQVRTRPQLREQANGGVSGSVAAGGWFCLSLSAHERRLTHVLCASGGEPGFIYCNAPLI
jgi:hypothetical protein